MQHSIPRRKFLKTVGIAGLAAAGSQWSGSTADAQASAVPDTDTSKMPRLFAGCCAYSYNHALRKGTMTMEDFIRKAVELRVDGVDMTAYYLKSTDPEYLDGLRHLAYKNAMPFSGSACGVSMVQADPSKRTQSLAEIKKVGGCHRSTWSLSSARVCWRIAIWRYAAARSRLDCGDDEGGD